MKAGAALRAGNRLGVVCDGPDKYGYVKLLREDGSTTAWINRSALARPSEADLAAAPWLERVLGDADTGWVKVGTPLLVGARLVVVQARGDAHQVSVAGLDGLPVLHGGQALKVPLPAMGRPTEAEAATCQLHHALSTRSWDTATEIASEQACSTQADGVFALQRGMPHTDAPEELLLQLAKNHAAACAKRCPETGKLPLQHALERGQWADVQAAMEESELVQTIAKADPDGLRVVQTHQAVAQHDWDAVARLADGVTCAEPDAAGQLVLHNLLRAAENWADAPEPDPAAARRALGQLASLAKDHFEIASSTQSQGQQQPSAELQRIVESADKTFREMVIALGGTVEESSSLLRIKCALNPAS
eukprot:COSAG06_NODE_2536_length_6709_cov_42.478669_6_plen_363_part_00